MTSGYSRKKTLSISLLSILLTALSLPAIADFHGTVIYGDDNRKDIVDTVNPLYREIAQSTVALVKAGEISLNGNSSKIDAPSFGESMGMCKQEPFYEQPSGAFCSGSLVGEDLILTAGHCVTSQSECMGTKFVFNFAVDHVGRDPSVGAASDVYSCKTLLGRAQNNNGDDWAVVRVDRKVTDHRPLVLDANAMTPGTSILVIGHPAGIPTKVADGAVVRDFTRNGYFTANLDTYGGNSGSAVFNAESGKVVGVLVRGERDYVSRNGCSVSNVCSSTGCRGEDVTKISAPMDTIRRGQSGLL